MERMALVGRKPSAHATHAALLQVHTGPAGIRAETDEASARSFGAPAPAAAAPSYPAPKA